MPAGAGESGPGEETEQRGDDLSEAGHIQVVQFNPFYGGQYPKYAYTKEGYTSLPHTYATAETFASMLHAKYPKASVIGMQEIVSVDNAEQIRLRLAQATGKPWNVQHFGKSKADGPNAIPSTQEAIFWRADLIALAEDFGTREVQRYKTKKGTVVSVRFGGGLFYKLDNGRPFGFFTGKLTPRYQHDENGHPLGDDDKVIEVKTLQKWIDDKMGDHPNETRVVAMDMNAGYGSEPWDQMSLHFGDDHDKTKTWKSPDSGNWYRYDYVWWDFDAGTKRSTGFFDDPHVIGETGSDHRAVFSEIYVRDPDGEVPGHACQVRCCNDDLFKVYAGKEDQCRDLWTVCRDHGYAKRIRWNGDLIFSKASCGN